MLARFICLTCVTNINFKIMQNLKGQVLFLSLSELYLDQISQLHRCCSRFRWLPFHVLFVCDIPQNKENSPGTYTTLSKTIRYVRIIYKTIGHYIQNYAQWRWEPIDYESWINWQTIDLLLISELWCWSIVIITTFSNSGEGFSSYIHYWKTNNTGIVIDCAVKQVRLVGWLCLTFHRQRGHLEMAPPFTVTFEGREVR